MTQALNLGEFAQVITLGPKGTFSNQAASVVVGDSSASIKYTSTLPEICMLAAGDAHALGVIPIENSSSGIVGPTQDSLVENEVVVVAELQIQVSYGLVSRVPVEEVETFYCHKVAFDQVMSFTAKKLSQAKVHFVDSNMDAAFHFARSGQDEKVAAVMPLVVAQKDEILQGEIVAEGIEDYQNNCTRFLVVRKPEEGYQPDFGRQKTSLVIESHEDRHSLLFEILREFHVFGLNLCRLESRPSKVHRWQYRFFIDFINNHRTEPCLAALAELGISYKVLGSYDSLT